MKILIAEDDRVSRRVLELFLAKWGYEVVLADDGDAAWKRLQEADAPRLALLDWMMPGMDGVQLCRAIRKREGKEYVYIILLTAKGQKQDLLDGLEAGADDYVVKPFDAPELRARLRAGKRIVELQAQLLEAGEALRFQASHDPLTALWNRSAVLSFLGKELARTRRSGVPVSVVLLDLDHFKQINDQYGHLTGDAVLREAVRRMTSSVRDYDSIGRYGGEEFLFVAPSSDLSGSARLAERVRVALESSPVETPAGPIPVTASLGVASSVCLETPDVDTLLRLADEALYRAKRAGRNRVELAAGAEHAGEAPSISVGPSETPSRSR